MSSCARWGCEEPFVREPSGEGLAGGFEKEAYFGWGVGGGDEGGFVLAGWEPDAGFEEGAMETSEGDGVGGRCAVEIRDRSIGEEPGEHRSDTVDGHGDSDFVGDAAYTFGDAGGCLFEAVVDIFTVVDQVAEGRDTCGHREWVAAEGSGLIDGA